MSGWPPGRETARRVRETAPESCLRWLAQGFARRGHYRLKSTSSGKPIWFGLWLGSTIYKRRMADRNRSAAHCRAFRANVRFGRKRTLPFISNDAQIVASSGCICAASVPKYQRQKDVRDKIDH